MTADCALWPGCIDGRSCRRRPLDTPGRNRSASQKERVLQRDAFTRLNPADGIDLVGAVPGDWPPQIGEEGRNAGRNHIRPA